MLLVQVSHQKVIKREKKILLLMFKTKISLLIAGSLIGWHQNEMYKIRMPHLPRFHQKSKFILPLSSALSLRENKHTIPMSIKRALEISRVDETAEDPKLYALCTKTMPKKIEAYSKIEAYDSSRSTLLNGILNAQTSFSLIPAW